MSEWKNQDFSQLTVLELRKVAKEKGVKLGAGISKQGIIDKLTEAGKANTPAADSQDALPEDKARTIRSAAIITDETVEDDEDDVLNDRDDDEDEGSDPRIESGAPP